MSASPILLALARLRLMHAFPARLWCSLAAALRPLAAVASLRALCGRYTLWLAAQIHALVRRARKLRRDRAYGRRRALLIGIQSSLELVDLPEPEAEQSLGLRPNLARAGSKRTKAVRKKRVKPKEKVECEAPALLKGPHHDVQSMRTVLIDKYGYHPDDIVILIDDENPAHPQPTRDNIVTQIRYLVKDVRDGDKLFLHYAGHADQEVTDDVEEEDGMNEFIVACDGYKIMDDTLHMELIRPLANIKCTLTAVLDCCHSGSLLDLPHIHCNAVYVPWLNKGKRRTKTLWANRPGRRDAVFFMPEQLPSPTSGEVHSDVPFTSWVPPRNHRRPVPLSINTDSTGYPTPPGSFHSREPSFNVPDITIEVVQSPEADMQSFVSPAHFTTSPVVTFKWCNGTCRDDPFAIKCDKVFEETKVVCLSASKDGELSWEDGNGRSLTQYLAKNLTDKPHPTFHDLLTTVSHDIHEFYVTDLHCNARSYKKKMSSLGRTIDPRTCDPEMHNFQNPQLSSFIPLNMQELFDP